MLPRLCFSFDRLLHRKKKEGDGIVAGNANGLDLRCRSVVGSRRQGMSPRGCSLRAHKSDRREEIKERKREMGSKVVHISDLIHRVASSCLTHRLPGSDAGMHDTHSSDDGGGTKREEEEEDQATAYQDSSPSASPSLASAWEDEKGVAVMGRVSEMESLMSEVFEAVSAVKRAYVSLQDAHSPWDPDVMRVSDASVVAELRRLGRLRDRFRRGALAPAAAAPPAPPMREVVAPYEAAIEDLRRELRAKEAEVDVLKEKLMTRSGGGAATPRGSGRKGRPHHSKRVGCSSGFGTPVAAPTAELFEKCMEEVKSATKSFTANLLSLMRAARWDIAAAARSIIESSEADGGGEQLTIPSVDPGHAKHAMESYVTRKILQGFENETFYMDGSLSSLLNPAEYRRSCLAQFRDMRAMDPAELLGILPTCSFGSFASNKYLSLLHPKMEESLFGGLDQRRHVLAGAHPRTGFYGEYLRMAKAVWMLHLLAFALDPSPSHFEASKGADFHPDYMESVVRFPGGRVPSGFVVGFSVGPGFKLGNGSVVRARVYLVPRLRHVL